MMTCNGFRTPALLAKMAATVDAVSGGRLEFGLGAGVQAQEHAAYGFSFPELKLRVQRLKEAVELIQALWTKEKTTYKGAHYAVADAICEPKPVQKPHPPIVIGGCSEKYLLRVTAQYADRLDFGYLPTYESYTHKLDVLAKHCKSVGRDFGEIEKACWPQGQIILVEDRAALEEKVRRLKPAGVSRKEFERYNFLGTPEQFQASLEPYFALGVSQFMLFFADLPDLDSLRLFAKTQQSL
jgi:alkanesulfonate monooxygenase SsuD/methylene tetrahydromethanopterin reductase-like flavin-dependent oxidoreductase (luciferase family)